MVFLLLQNSCYCCCCYCCCCSWWRWQWQWQRNVGSERGTNAVSPDAQVLLLLLLTMTTTTLIDVQLDACNDTLFSSSIFFFIDAQNRMGVVCIFSVDTTVYVAAQVLRIEFQFDDTLLPTVGNSCTNTIQAFPLQITSSTTPVHHQRLWIWEGG